MKMVIVVILALLGLLALSLNFSGDSSRIKKEHLEIIADHQRFNEYMNETMIRLDEVDDSIRKHAPPKYED